MLGLNLDGNQVFYWLPPFFPCGTERYPGLLAGSITWCSQHQSMPELAERRYSISCNACWVWDLGVFSLQHPSFCRDTEGSRGAQPALIPWQGTDLLSAADLCSRSKSAQSRGERRCRDWDASALGCLGPVWLDLIASIRAQALLAGQRGVNPLQEVTQRARSPAWWQPPSLQAPLPAGRPDGALAACQMASQKQIITLLGRLM